MKKNDIIMIVAVLGGGYLAYWYLTNYGPGGAVHNAAGQQVAPSWWDTWFGGAGTAAPAPAGTGTAIPPGTTVNSTPATGTYTQTQTPPASAPNPQPAATSSSNLRAQLLSASGGVNSLNADQWSYYLTAVRGTALTPAQFGQAFPSLTGTDRGPAMSVDQFLAAVAPVGVSGLGALTPVPTVSAFPSMSFGGSLKQSAFRPAFGAKGGGGYLQ